MIYKRNPVPTNKDYKASLDYGEIDIVKEKVLKKTRKNFPKSAFKTLGKTKSKESPFYDQLIKEQKEKIEDYHKRGKKLIIIFIIKN